MKYIEKKKLAYRIGFGLVSGFPHWDVFSGESRPKKDDTTESVWEYRRKIENLVKELAADFLSAC